MKRSLVAAALALALGTAVAPAADAKPGHAPGGPHGPSQPSNPGDRQLTAAQRAVAAQVKAKDAGLVRAVRTVTRAELVVGEDLLATIETDRAALAALGADAAAATTVADVRAVGEQVKTVRPETYAILVTGLRQAARAEAKVADNDLAIADLASAADAAELEGADVTAVRAALDAATLANDEALTQVYAATDAGVLLGAFSPREDRDAFAAAVHTAGDALEVVEEQLELAAAALEALSV